MTIPHLNVSRGVNEAFAQGLELLSRVDELAVSRVGEVAVAPGPVITTTLNPMERVLFSPKRDANPFFHLFESLWMLAGRDDLPWLAQFNKQMANYSDDGGATQPGAYGFRWRKWFGYDQLEAIVQHLSAFPNSRRAVLTMWDAWPLHASEEGVWRGGDLEKAGQGADVPCNTNIFFSIRDNELLDMSVQCRSNDAVWGAHGANAVHFSVLLEYMAARLDLGVGVLHQYSFNYHAYPNNVKFPLIELAHSARNTNGYTLEMAKTTPLFDSETVGGAFERELAWFMEVAAVDRDPDLSYPTFQEPLFVGLALPMLHAWQAHKANDYDKALKHVRTMPAGSDWALACQQWLERRQLARSGDA